MVCTRVEVINSEKLNILLNSGIKEGRKIFKIGQGANVKKQYNGK
jgi:hypothetical protein